MQPVIWFRAAWLRRWTSGFMRFAPVVPVNRGPPVKGVSGVPAFLFQAAPKILPHKMEEDGSGGLSPGQGVAGVRDLAAAVEQRIADRLEDGDLS